MKYHTSSQSGFSLVETLVAITILLIVIVGPMTISATAARSTSFSSEQVIAFFLAQEGAEIAQKARDDMILVNFNLPSNPSVGWGVFTNVSGIYANCFNLTKGCGLELNTDPTGSLKSPIDCSGSCLLYYNSTGNRSRYTHTSTLTSTPYTRIVYFENINNNEVKVISKVTWRTGSQKKAQEAVIETYLFNVYRN